MSAEPKGQAGNRLLYDKGMRLVGEQRARRMRNDDFNSTTYRDWMLRKERPLLSASAYLLVWVANLGPVALLAWHGVPGMA